MLYCSLYVPFILSLLLKESRSRETKHEEVMVEMRDGVKLHTEIFLPRNYVDDRSPKVPAVVDRSPYGYGDMEWITDIFMPFGFAAVGQDMRGTELSEGNFSMWQSDANDGTDLGNWIVNQSWSNGEIYTFGMSADGLGSIELLKANDPWLKGQYAGWCPAIPYDILIPYGTYKQKTVEDWLLGLTMPNPDVVYDNIETVHKNEAPASDYWKSISIYEEDFATMKGKTASWSGWYDLFLMSNLNLFDGYNKWSDPSVAHTSLLTIDACGHCLEAGPYFTQNAVQGRTALVLGQLFETYGVWEGPNEKRASQIKNISFYVMSSNDTAGQGAGLYWTSVEKFPTPTMTDYYFHSDGTATTAKSSDSDSSSTYIYDPSDPVPTLGGNNLPASIGGSIPCGPWDQSSLKDRKDILTFNTPIVQENEVLALTGPMFATLYVSSDAIDTDFHVKISDVYPTGEVRIIMDNALRMRWLEGGYEPTPVVKGKIYELNINVWNTSYVVAPGHSLQIAISSSNFPRFSVNPNNGILLDDPAYPGPNITASNTLYHSAEYPSKVVLPIVEKTQIPSVDVLHEANLRWPMMTDELLAKAEKHFGRWAMGKKPGKK